MGFFIMLVAALVAMAKGAGKGTDWCWRNFWGFFGGGGSGGATPQPLDLPSQEVFEVDRSLAEGQQRAADIMANENAARQIRMYSSAKPDERYAIDLSKLEPDQQDWLTGLSFSEKSMKTLSETPESKIMMLLSGHDVVPGIAAPKMEKVKEVIPGLASRMEDFRLKLATREGNHILAA